MTVSPMTPYGILLEIGQVWKERDGRLNRSVEICGWASDGLKVQIRGIRTTWASINRFSGLSGGYYPVSVRTPYPWCRGNPTKEDCAKAGYCKKDPNCGE